MDNGAKALAERLHGQNIIAGFCDHTGGFADCEADAGLILANGAVFLPDAAELDRLRRIEAAAEEVIYRRDYRITDESRIGALRAALQPEGSAGTTRCGNCPHDPDAHSPVNLELCAMPGCKCPGLLTVAAEGSARDGG